MSITDKEHEEMMKALRSLCDDMYEAGMRESDEYWRRLYAIVGEEQR